MKCKKCGSSNRRGVKFCEECGEPLPKAAPLKKKSISLVCPSCSFKNRAGVKFCEECGMDLKAPAPAVSKSPKKTVRRSTKIPGTPPAVQQSAPAVVVEVREEKKRRLNPLWLLILLLLLLICCCGLLLTDAVEVPEFIAPYINPIIDNFRPALPDFDDGGQVDKPEIDEFDCEEFQEKVRELDAWGEFDCDHDAGICTTTEDITGLGLEDYEDIEILYEWDDLGPEVADCDGPPKN